MPLPPEHLQTILDLESRHDQLLDLLADLEKRVARVLAECQSARPAASLGSSPQSPTEDNRPARAAA
mgnify:CR=1 FL=1